MTLSTMVNNYIVQPLVRNLSVFSFIRKELLKVKWALVSLIILFGYINHVKVTEFISLVNIGIFSFVAILQLTPAGFGAIIWKDANRNGAVAGIIAGTVIWFYTLIIPLLSFSGIIGNEIVQDGIFGIRLLRPEHLFGIEQIDNVSNAVLWSLVFNIGLYVLVSRLSRQTYEETEIANRFVDIDLQESYTYELEKLEQGIDLSEKLELLKKVFCKYFSEEDFNKMSLAVQAELGLENRKYISILELADIRSKAEKILSGAIGVAVAHHELRDSNFISSEEKLMLSTVYVEMLARLNLPPAELIKKIDYHKERERLVTDHSNQLKETIKQKEQEIEIRIKIEKQLRKAERKYRNIFENAVEGIFQSTYKGHFINVNPTCAKF